jgi:chromosome segregation ATPase
MFKKLCGEKAYQSVILGTIHWSNINPEDGLRREKELIETDEYWGLMYKKGSRVFRYANTRESALSLIGYILKQHMTATLDIQDEMVNKGHNINETSASHELNTEITRERKRHMAELTAMREQMEEAIKERDEELQQNFKEEIDMLQEKIQKGAKEQQKHRETFKEVDKCKEAEFRAFKEQMKKERDQERQRYDAKRQKHMARIAQQEEALKEQQRREMERMEEDKASLEEMARKQEEYHKAMKRQWEEDKRRLADIEDSHPKFKEDLEEATRRRKNSE